MIIYLSGPMSGLPDKNHAEFNWWARIFREKGHQVLNPAENDGGSQDKAWNFYMRLDMESLLQAETILLLPGWQYSLGAKIEMMVAATLKIPCYDIKDFAANVRPKQVNYSADITISIHD